MNDVVALNVFTTDVRNHRDINETRREVLGSNFPTSTMVQGAGVGATRDAAGDQRHRGYSLTPQKLQLANSRVGRCVPLRV